MENKINEFEMNFDCWQNGWSYYIENGYIKESHASNFFQIRGPGRSLKQYKLNLELIEDLELIKDNHLSNDSHRILETEKLLEKYDYEIIED